MFLEIGCPFIGSQLDLNIWMKLPNRGVMRNDVVGGNEFCVSWSFESTHEHADCSPLWAWPFGNDLGPNRLFPGPVFQLE